MNNVQEILKLVGAGNLISTEQKKEIEPFCQHLRNNDKDFNILFFGNTHARITTSEKYIESFYELQTLTKHS